MYTKERASLFLLYLSKFSGNIFEIIAVMGVYPFAMVRILLNGYIRDPGSGPPLPLRGLDGAAGLPP